MLGNGYQTCMNKLNQAKPFKIPKSARNALWVQIDEGPHFYDQLHYHPEIQITAIVKGAGVLYAGHNMKTFDQKSIFVIGGDVPHLLKNQKAYYLPGSLGVYSVSLFFDESSFGPSFLELDELKNLKKVVQDSKMGIKLSGEPAEQIYHRILQARNLHQEQLVINLFEVLSLIHQTKKEYLNDSPYILKLNTKDGNRLNEILDYTFQHYKETIKIEQILEVACLSRSQFSYFFKLHTGKTYIQFLNDLRIEQACIQLINTNETIEQICYEVGFQNVSNFVRHFNRSKGQTPSGYRKLWRLKSFKE